MIENKRCQRCVMDTSATEISFDDQGVCSFCHDYDVRVQPRLARAESSEGEQLFAGVIERIHQTGATLPYDSILGLSGGVDSSYLAHLASRHGLRPLALHVDMGWNTDESQANIRKLTRHLHMDLETITVDFNVMQALQLAFYRSGVKNCEIPQDHAFLAVLYRKAAEHGVRAILTGGNLATESILPRSWGYNAGDAHHLRAIHRRYGNGGLRGFPTLGFVRRYLYYPLIHGIEEIRLLDFVPYNREEAKKLLAGKYEWVDYGPKHFESVLTRFFQGYYLPTKFGIDKRKAHFSSLILSGQMTREDALAKLGEPPYSESWIEQDKRVIAEALRLSVDEWEAILNAPPQRHEDFPSQRVMFALKDRMVRFMGIRERLKR
jgi:N-acetyl sugar amidotransferase